MSNTPTIAECASCLSCDYTLRGVMDTCTRHTVCYPCLYKWTRRNNTCPLCRVRVGEITSERVRDAATAEERDAESIGNGSMGGGVIYLTDAQRAEMKRRERELIERYG